MLATRNGTFLIFAEQYLCAYIYNSILSVIWGGNDLYFGMECKCVIAAAISIFTRSSLAELRIGLVRYMIHGLPEIAAYFIAAMAGEIISVAVIRHEATI